MHVFAILTIGFFVGVVLTALFGARVATDARNDTEALLNGIETRIHRRLDELKATTVATVTATAASVAKDASKI